MVLAGTAHRPRGVVHSGVGYRKRGTQPKQPRCLAEVGVRTQKIVLSFKTFTPFGPGIREFVSRDIGSNLDAIVVPVTEASLPGDLGLQMLDSGNMTIAPPAGASAEIMLFARVKRLRSEPLVIHDAAKRGCGVMRWKSSAAGPAARLSKESVRGGEAAVEHK